MKKLVHTLQSSKITLTFIVLFFVIISFNLKLLILPIILFIIKYSKRLKIKLLILVIIIFMIYFLYVNNIKIPSYLEGNFCVINKRSFDNTYLYTIKKGFKSYQVYLKNDLAVGQYLKIKGYVSKYDSVRIPKGFNKYQYYLSKGVLGEVDLIAYQISKWSNPIYKFSAINVFEDNLYINIFFGTGLDNFIDQDNLQYLNIIHYFSISGLHIYLIFKIISMIIFHLNLNPKIYQVVKILITIIFYFLSTFSLSIFRIFLYEVFKYLNKRYNLKINNFILLNISFVIMILINPFNIINNNLLIMYLIVNGISLLRPLYERSNYLVKSIKISFIATLIILPFTLKVNLIGILFAPIFIIIICYLIFPLSVLSIFSSSVTKVLKVGFNYLNKLVNLFSEQSNLITFPKLNCYVVILYFVLIISLLYINKKYYATIISVIVIVLYSPAIFNNFKEPSLVFLDVGQGDSAVYRSNSFNIVIDTFDGTVDYLLNEGINTINYLILTHSHNDHIKEANLLISSLKVNYIIINPYDDYNLIFSNKTKTIKVYDDITIRNKDVILSFFGSKIDYSSSNNNSLVFKMTFQDNNVLFTGDIEKERETELINKYNSDLRSKYLKVAHHGSSSSSTKEFIDRVDPSYAIISVSKKNRYQLPSEEVVNRFKYKGIVVYQTKDCKTIKLINRKLVFM